MHTQFLQEMLLRIDARLQDRTLDILAHFVRVMVKGPDLDLFVASMSLVGIPKPAGGIRPIRVGITYRCLVGKVALYLVSENTIAYIQPQQLGVEVPRGAEAIVHSFHRYVTRHASSRDHRLAHVDLSNACIHVTRAEVLRAVELVRRTILPWVALTLCHRSHL